MTVPDADSIVRDVSPLVSRSHPRPVILPTHLRRFRPAALYRFGFRHLRSTTPQTIGRPAQLLWTHARENRNLDEAGIHLACPPIDPCVSKASDEVVT